MSMFVYDTPFLDHLTRPFPVAVCGAIKEYRHNRESNSFTLEFSQDKEYDAHTVVFAHKEIDSIETDGEYKIIPFEKTGRSHIEFKTGIGNHKIKVNFK